MKKITRRQVRAWFYPIRKTFNDMRRTGEVDSVRGYAVTRLHNNDDYARIDYCIAGWRGCLSRLFPDADLSPMERIEKRLASGVLLTVAEIDEAQRLLNQMEDRMTGLPSETIRSAVLTEQLAIEIDAMSS